jgi:RNA polymerase sigma-70 factor (ECF subfamily)
MSDPRTESNAAQPPPEPSNGGPAGVDATSDEMLLLGARMRDEAALLTLFDRYGGLLYTLALRVVGDRALAEDVTHDVFLRCWHGLDEYDATHGTLPAWLLGIARRRAVDVVRSRQLQPRPPEIEPLTEFGASGPEVPGSEPEASGADDDAPVRARVREALGEIPDSGRAAVELAYFGGLTQAEVAKALGEPDGAVRVRIRDGLRRLRRLLAPVVDDGPGRTGGAP